MAEPFVLAFDNEDGALQVRDKLLDIQKHRSLQLAAAVVRRQDGKVKVKQLNDLVGSGSGGQSLLPRRSLAPSGGVGGPPC